jgi:hypothetical protein
MQVSMKPRRTHVSLILAASVSFASAAQADFKDVIAARFSSRADYIIVNLPPRPGAWPGAILTYNMHFPAKAGDRNDPASRRGDKAVISAEDGFHLDANSKASVWGSLKVPQSVGDSADVVMSFADAQALEMEPRDLARRIESAEAASAAARRGQMPLVIRRAYVGTPFITVSRKANASQEDWAKVKAGLEASARGASVGDAVTYPAGEPFAFAFEADQINFDPGELAKGATKVTFAPLPAQLFAAREQESDRALAAAESAISAITGLSAREVEQKWIFIDAAKASVPSAAAPGPAGGPAQAAAPVAVVPAAAPAASTPAPPARPTSIAAAPARGPAARPANAQRPPPRAQRARKPRPAKHRRR